ncbi:shikimate dehydrogenase [Lapillicoccus jejuensis]|uniref:shikimate dehydrogenase n=1 Tax=Lapillicoccus jejuensis TaxID=402171 RepID=UPI001FE61C77|nr:shikimate dehydrogenase [Lapillicoccus jejuensis]
MLSEPPAGPTTGPTGGRRAGVLGSPVAHSLSPVLHRAAYDALHLTGWTYDAARVEADGLEAHLAGLGPQWVGLSLTMPLKEAALALADETSDLARATGAANTLVRRADGSWSADNTDVHGLVAALGEAGVTRLEELLVLGSGATARAAVAAAAALGARRVRFMVRAEARPETVAQARAAGLEVATTGPGRWPATVEAVVSTVPPAATADWVAGLPAGGTAALDAVYGDGDTPLLAAARARGWAALPGTLMLLHQGARQVELMTGRPAPLEAMRAALAAATGHALAPTAR